MQGYFILAYYSSFDILVVETKTEELPLEKIKPGVHIVLPECYLIGQLDQLSQRSDIRLNLMSEKGPSLQCRAPSGIFKKDILFKGYEFHSFTKSNAGQTWWNFRLNHPLREGNITGPQIVWLIDFFTKSVSLKLQSVLDDDFRNRFSL